MCKIRTIYLLWSHHLQISPDNVLAFCFSDHRNNAYSLQNIWMTLKEIKLKQNTIWSHPLKTITSKSLAGILLDFALHNKQKCIKMKHPVPDSLLPAWGCFRIVTHTGLSTSPPRPHWSSPVDAVQVASACSRLWTAQPHSAHVCDSREVEPPGESSEL